MENLKPNFLQPLFLNSFHLAGCMSPDVSIDDRFLEEINELIVNEDDIDNSKDENEEQNIFQLAEKGKELDSDKVKISLNKKKIMNLNKKTNKKIKSAQEISQLFDDRFKHLFEQINKMDQKLSTKPVQYPNWETLQSDLMKNDKQTKQSLLALYNLEGE